MWLLAFLPARELAIVTTVGVLITGAAAPAMAAPRPKNRADVTVALSAPRNILSLMGSSTSVTATASNVGNAAAAGVHVTLSLPEPFVATELSTSSDWTCSFVSPGGVACDFNRDLAAGEQAFGIRLSARLTAGSPGQTLTGTSTITTTSRERSTANNAASQLFQIVGDGVIQGVFWHDLDADGVRETGEPIVDPSQLGAWSVDDEDLYGFSNGFGPYRLDVPAKRYYVDVTLWKADWRFTTPNAGDETTDSDLVPFSESSFFIEGRTEVFLVTVEAPTVIDVGLVRP